MSNKSEDSNKENTSENMKDDWEGMPLEDDAIEDKDEKSKKRTLFNDLRRFKKHTVSIISYGGEVIKGKLIGYDEVSNCIIETEEKNKIVVFGKLISMVCDGELHTF